MKSTLTDSQVTELLEALYADAARNDPRVHQAAREAGVTRESEADFYRAMPWKPCRPILPARLT